MGGTFQATGTGVHQSILPSQIKLPRYPEASSSGIDTTLDFSTRLSLRCITLGKCILTDRP